MSAAMNDYAIWKAFMAWAKDNLGQGYSLEFEDGSFTDPVTRWAHKGYRAGLIATPPQGELSALPELPEAQRRGIGLFTCWWSMLEAEHELADKPLDPESVVLHYMGCGASCMVHVKDLRAVCEFLNAAIAQRQEGGE